MALKDFLARGGKLIWVYTSGVFDEEGNFAGWDRPGGEDVPQINFEKVLGVSYADVPVVTSTEKVTLGQIIEKIKNMISTLKTSDALSGTTDEEITKEDYDKEWAKISALVSSYGYTSKLKSNLKNNTAYVLSFKREGTYFEVSAKEASTGVMASGQENCTFHFDIDGHPFRGRLLQDFALTDTPFLKVDLDIYTTKVASVRCRSKAYPAVTEWKYGGGKVVYVSFPPEKQESTIVMLKEIINTLSC